MDGDVSLVSVAVGDFNGDGKPDLVDRRVYGDNVSVLLGNGDGTFQAAVDYAAAVHPFSGGGGDFNGRRQARPGRRTVRRQQR